ncbi:MAG: imidazole glycerol phosphate synthase subunit HisH [Microscillaceae bacterium]|nr:imidazole glycerol phosphate synthase subunit HisH [Microscillaceae bacterium]
MRVAVIKYNAGNIQSLLFTLARIEGLEVLVSDRAEVIQGADKVIFPGVGEASSAMESLRAAQLDRIIRDLRQPFLGICLGMQLMSRKSEENETTCLDIFEGEVKKFEAVSAAEGLALKVPHMGWNKLTNLRGDLFAKVAEGSFAYFVHSYYAALTVDTIATCSHGEAFSAALQKGNYYGVQFHPEKSAETGLQILKNFLAL